MEFWGLEVKSGQSLTVEPGEGMILHLSQACLGEVKKNHGSEMLRLFVNKGGQKLVLGSLSLEKFPQVIFDLIFEDEFELSHDGKHGSVHFAGYKSAIPEDDSSEEEDSDDDSDIPEPLPLHVNNALNNGKAVKPAVKSNSAAKSEAGASKPRVNFAEPSKTEDDSDDSDEEEDSDEDDDDESGEDEEMANAEGDDIDDDESDDDDSDDEEDDSEEETPKKAEPSKKRAADSAAKTPVSNKKSKLSTPQKTDGKKASGHVATPHPAKQAGKTPKQQTPKSSGGITCGSCDRAFGSEQALQSHSKAKHGAK